MMNGGSVRRRGPGAAARMALLAVTVGTVVAADGWRLAASAGVFLLLAAALHPAGFRVWRRLALWILLTALALPPLVFGSPRDLVIVAGVAVARDALWLAGALIVRAAVIAVASAGFAATVSGQALTDVFEAVGLRGVGFSLGVAMHALPTTVSTWSTAARALRLRGGFRDHALRDAGLLAITVIGNALRHADEVVEAAYARGFSPDRPAPGSRVRWRGDAVWTVLWLGLAAVLLFAR
jgi:energy-coupling factor transporter transmembrane protein EcfT